MNKQCAISSAEVQAPLICCPPPARQLTSARPVLVKRLHYRWNPTKSSHHVTEISTGTRKSSDLTTLSNSSMGSVFSGMHFGVSTPNSICSSTSMSSRKTRRNCWCFLRYQLLILSRVINKSTHQLVGFNETQAIWKSKSPLHSWCLHIEYCYSCCTHQSKLCLPPTTIAFALATCALQLIVEPRCWRWCKYAYGCMMSEYVWYVGRLKVVPIESPPMTSHYHSGHNSLCVYPALHWLA